MRKYKILKKIKKDFDCIKNKKIFIAVPLHNKKSFFEKFIKTINVLQDIMKDDIVIFHLYLILDKNFDIFFKDNNGILNIILNYSYIKQINCSINVAEARNIGFEQFKKKYKKFDYYLTLDDDTIITKQGFYDSIFYLENTNFDFIAKDYFQIKKQLFPIYGEFYEKKIKQYNNLTYGACYFLCKSKVAIQGNYNLECAPREDCWFVASLFKKQFIGCRTKLKIIHKRHKRSIESAFCRGSKEWLNSCELLQSNFPNLIDRYSKTGNLYMNKDFLKKEKEVEYIWDDNFLYKVKFEDNE
jgi:hypothetical protein